MSKEFKTYKKDIVKVMDATKKRDKGSLDYEDAERIIVDYLTDQKMMTLNLEGKFEEIQKTKAYLRKVKSKYRRLITDCIFKEGISIKGYGNDKVGEFIEEMVNEYGGFSILEDAFNDENVSDIYCLSWDNIFVEKNGKNVPYEKTFRNKEHYKSFLEKLARLAKKEVNQGDGKIVDFDLYGDRYCATSDAVSPVDYSLTIRKHKEDHIILDQLLEWEVMNEEMSDFYGTIIDGELNLIYAGITGSGKTTTIRALIDFYIERNGKRMLVCEDTQELFPKNKHTLQLVSFKSENVSTSIPLDKLIITALRLKPKYIIVGEVRGLEATAAVEAMETGHSTIFTMHGGTVWNIVNRLVTKYLMGMPSLGMDVVERIIGSAVDYVAIQDDIPGIGRICSVISEIDYDFAERRIVIRDIFRYNFDENYFELKQRLSPEKINTLLRRGVDYKRAKKWERLDNPEEEAKVIKEINEKYLNEREERRKNYKERKEKRELDRLSQIIVADDVDINEDLDNIKMIEKLKQSELNDMLNKTKKVKDN